MGPGWGDSHQGGGAVGGALDLNVGMAKTSPEWHYNSEDGFVEDDDDGDDDDDDDDDGSLLGDELTPL